MKVPVEKMGPESGGNYKQWSMSVANELKSHGSNCLTDQNFYIQIYNKNSAERLSKILGSSTYYSIYSYNTSEIARICADGNANARGKILSIKFKNNVKNVQNEVNRISSVYFIPLLTENSVVSESGEFVADFQVSNPLEYRYPKENLDLLLHEMKGVYGVDCCVISEPSE